MFYSAYLGEDIMKSGYTIAPGCVGQGGGRCSFNEFMEYIWAAFQEKGDTVRPTVRLFDEDKLDFATVKFSNIIQNLSGYKKAGMHKPITGNIDTSRISPGSSDYYAAMRYCGTVLARFRSFYDTLGDDNKDKVLSKNLLARAKEAAIMTVDIRAKEMDNNNKNKRIEDLEKRLRVSLPSIKVPFVSLPRKQGRDLTGRAGEYFVWDTAQTVRDIKDNPGMGTKVMEAVTEWKNDPANNNNNKNHWIAFQSAKMAESSCGC